MKPQHLILASRVFLGVVFLIACVEKILFPGYFALAIFRYRILPDMLVNPTALALPWMEFWAALGIMFTYRFRRASAAVLLALLAAFTAGIAFNLLRGVEIACGCTTTSAVVDYISWGHVARNLGYMFLAGLILKEEWVIDRLSFRRY